MRTLNFYGISSCLVPKLDASLPFVEVNAEYANNDIIFFDGVVPSNEELYNIMNKDDLIATYGDRKLGEVTAMTLKYEQDNTKLRRIVRKKPDVLEMPYLADGTIGWFAICLFEDVVESGKTPIIYSDSIGLDESELKFVTLESVTGTTGGENYLREISMVLTEVSDSEV